MYRRSVDSGTTFPNIIKNLNNNAVSSGRSVIALSGSSLHVVWNDDTFGASEILYRTSADNGSTFSPVLTNPILILGLQIAQP